MIKYDEVGKNLPLIKLQDTIEEITKAMGTISVEEIGKAMEAEAQTDHTNKVKEMLGAIAIQKACLDDYGIQLDKIISDRKKVVLQNLNQEKGKD